MAQQADPLAAHTPRSRGAELTFMLNAGLRRRT